MYVNPETGQRYTYDELVGLAGGVELVDQYISQNGLAELGDVEEIETEKIDFQQVTVPNAGASVVTDIDPAPENTELDLENISLASATDVFDEDQGVEAFGTPDPVNWTVEPIQIGVSPEIVGNGFTVILKVCSEEQAPFSSYKNTLTFVAAEYTVPSGINVPTPVGPPVAV